MLIGVVHGREADRLAPGLGKPAKRSEARRHLAHLAVAVHFLEEGGIAEPARIGIDGGRPCERAARIGDAKLIDDGRMPKKLRERLVTGVLGYRHDRAIAPTKRLAVMSGERRGVCSD